MGAQAVPPLTSQRELDAVVLESLPSQGAWSEEEYLWLADRSNQLIEFTDGAIEVLPMPTRKHRAISQVLSLAPLAAVQRTGGRVFYAPLRLRVRGGKYRDPDLLLLLDAADPRNGDRFWTGADLVVEVVSPGNPERDVVRKRRDYAEAGALEYWIVNPQSATISVLRLEGDAYVERGVFARGTQATSALLAGFVLDVSAVLDVDWAGLWRSLLPPAGNVHQVMLARKSETAASMRFSNGSFLSMATCVTMRSRFAVNSLPGRA